LVLVKSHAITVKKQQAQVPFGKSLPD